ncbi:pyridoxamine 5'-phosphate oxidase family protein [Bacillus aquiflavi]|uniref:Pyridoxamine 5'-phosphate oxidase family protein n=1 Tax=Bacillus aquiflavi TaxID=2672567 RepID=A0A6B3W054_9BACI|nr:pyridoxamine 5'-phosphate oxidase family protein [Bacillus aquiflavi]MBA4536874.1 pyridoxamine 5'-phosphate oxidase family protein [Bacillus aquiflavi]NEY81241.1 pyridoxamine 5'-phosphate oxidase family protein [Bacillus aquiflavi]
MVQDEIKTEEELRELLGFPSETVKRKAIDHLDRHCRHFISKSPFLIIATADRNGYCDSSPRGDAAGFVHVLSNDELVIPERPGNKRMDSLRNILDNPKLGLLFMIPGMNETLRINGQAKVIRDNEILTKMKAHDRIPLLGIRVKVEECYIHCAKSLIRSQLWDTASWPEKETLPSGPQILADHIKMPGVGEKEIAHALEESYSKRLY